MAFAALVMGSATSHGAYQEGKIAQDLGPDYVRTLACLDIGLAIHESLLDLDVGNRCAHNERFELSEMLIAARDRHGDPHDVSLVDPRNEIKPVSVGALEYGHERIRLDGIDRVDDICFELTGVVPDAPHTRSAPLCLYRATDGWHARPFS